jgi:hypothetical protein
MPRYLRDRTGTYDLTHVVAIVPGSHTTSTQPQQTVTLATLNFVGGQVINTASDYERVCDMWAAANAGSATGADASASRVLPAKSGNGGKESESAAAGAGV